MAWKFQANISSTRSAGDVLTNTARIDNEYIDENPNNNEFTVDVTIPFPEMSIDKNGDLTVMPGERMSYTLSYQNLNRETAEDVYIIDRLPDMDFLGNQDGTVDVVLESVFPSPNGELFCYTDVAIDQSSYPSFDPSADMDAS